MRYNTEQAVAFDLQFGEATVPSLYDCGCAQINDDTTSIS